VKWLGRGTLLALLVAPFTAAAQGWRATLAFDRGWRFHLGDEQREQGTTTEPFHGFTVNR